MGYTSFSGTNPIGRSGGTLLAWQEDQVCDIIDLTPNWIHILTKDESGKSCYITFVYGFPDLSSRHILWNWFLQTSSSIDLPWLATGDFNQIRNLHEKVSISKRVDGADLFNHMIQNCGFTDLNPTGTWFTWMNGRRNDDVVWARLDRALCNSDWLHNFPCTTFCSLPVAASDHSPLIINSSGDRPFCKRPFRFENLWLMFERCNSIVRSTWDINITASPDIIVHEKLNLLRGNLKIWNKRESHLNILNKQFTEDECLVALNQMKLDGAPGPDGFNVRFYRKYWDIVKNDVMSMLSSFFHDGSLSDQLNRSYITLIPKTNAPQSFKDFRPICLANVSYKLATKVLCNRLKSFLPYLIAPNQSAFLKGRIISDNIMLATELMHKIKSTKSGKSGWCALKLDIQKAYDKLSWNFIEAVLRRMKFPQVWNAYFSQCIKAVTYQLLLNGSITERFTPSCGIRQVKRVLDNYATLAGQRMNIQKSFLVFSPNVSHTSKKQIANQFNLKFSSTLGKYLGRLTLIKSVINSYLVYPLSCMQFSKDQCQKIESLMSHFFWGHNGDNPKLHLQRWDLLCRPKYQGGLALCDVYAFNQALLAKHIWRLIDHSNRLGDLTLVPKYMDHTNWASFKHHSSSSWRWKAVLKSKDLILNNLGWQIGDGKSINTNHHVWWQMLRDQQLYPTVSDLIQHNIGSWNLDLLRSVYNPITVNSITSHPISITGCKDRMIWNASSDGQYTVMEGYKYLLNHNLHNSGYHFHNSHGINMYEWFKSYLNSSFLSDDHQINFICVGLNVIWRCRNLRVMEGKHIDPVKAISMIYALWSSYKYSFSVQSVSQKFLIPASNNNPPSKTTLSMPSSGLNVICITKKRRTINGKATTVHVFIMQNNKLLLHGAYGLNHQRDLRVTFLLVLRRGIQLSTTLTASTDFCNIIVFQKGWATMITSSYKKFSRLQVLGTDIHNLLRYFSDAQVLYLSFSNVLNSFIRKFCNISFKVGWSIM
ncbi:Transposon TX1 uncharacterized 149 kDa protein [Senna tora]|uniref:Transposon TX1 uncharacterized 149 kDa protein n=1 Tax=Senna tora TaxID=362788 RepID=A0A834TRA6_9FABA|nr:Transposon TX1 uncharacterized 149 kDa protein [Senna tora]